MRLTESQLLFLARFAKAPEGKEFVELLRTKLAEVEGKLRTQDGAEMHRQQGRAIQLDELIADIAQASAKLNAAQSAARPRRVAHYDEIA